MRRPTRHGPAATRNLTHNKNEEQMLPARSDDDRLNSGNAGTRGMKFLNSGSEHTNSGNAGTRGMRNFELGE